MGLESIVKKVVSGIALAGTFIFGSMREGRASIVQEPIQTSQSTQPIITMLDYRYGDIADVGHSGIYNAQSFIALDEWITDGSLKLARISENEHNMYLKIWPDNNGIPDVTNEIGTTTNELTPRGDTLVDYYLTEFGFNPIQVTKDERYWIGLYNPDLNHFGLGVHYRDYAPYNPYPNGEKIGKYSNDTSWIIESDRDLSFSVTFSNIPEPGVLELLGLGSLGLLKLIRRRNKN